MQTDDQILAMVLAVFREEQAEHRQAAGELLLELERTPEHPNRAALLDQLFREAHSLKGGARAAGQLEIEQLAHRVEDLFSAVREGRLLLTPEICDPVYATLDAIGTLMNQVNAGQPADIRPFQPLLDVLAQIVESPSPLTQQKGSQKQQTKKRERIQRQSSAKRELTERVNISEQQVLSNGHAVGVASHQSEDSDQLLTPVYEAPTSNGSTNGSTNGSAHREGPWDTDSSTIRIPITVLDNLLGAVGELTTCTVGAQQQARVMRELSSTPARWRRIWRQTSSAVQRLQGSGLTFQPTVHYLDDRDTILSRNTPSRNANDTMVLVNALLQANTLISELEQQIAQQAQQIATDHARLSAVTDQLQTQVRRTRMLPLTTIFSPLRLQLREMARTAGKQVTLELDDGGAEADRQILERLGEILLHLLRNAIDHGIEPSAVRIANGKTPEGRITLQAKVSGDRLTVTFADDGTGLNLAAIRQRAREYSQINTVDVARMTEAELIDLIFIPGFSTKQMVNTLSGRGVGLDIVRSRVERMQGRISVCSTPQAGCVFTLNLPLSLTSSHGLLLRVGTTTYVLPLDAIQRIIPVTGRDLRTLEGHAAILLDDRPLAVVHLADLLEPATSGSSRNTNSAWHGLLLGSGERQVVCLVDAVFGEQELVVHRLPAPIQQVQCIAGATILADGKIVPILDVVDLLQAALSTRRTIQLSTNTTGAIRQPTILVVDDSITTRTLEQNILEAAGYRVHLATDGAAALQTLNQLAADGGCDLLLSDVDMPLLNGFDLTARVRADTRFQHLPVVLVTSLDAPEDRARGIAAGADAYIVKRQFEQQTLLDTIARLI